MPQKKSCPVRMCRWVCQCCFWWICMDRWWWLERKVGLRLLLKEDAELRDARRRLLLRNSTHFTSDMSSAVSKWNAAICISACVSMDVSFSGLPWDLGGLALDSFGRNPISVAHPWLQSAQGWMWSIANSSRIWASYFSLSLSLAPCISTAGSVVWSGLEKKKTPDLLLAMEDAVTFSAFHSDQEVSPSNCQVPVTAFSFGPAWILLCCLKLLINTVTDRNNNHPLPISPAVPLTLHDSMFQSCISFFLRSQVAGDKLWNVKNAAVGLMDGMPKKQVPWWMVQK